MSSSYHGTMRTTKDKWIVETYISDVLFFAFPERPLGGTILFLALEQSGFIFGLQQLD